jgi:hypothetical protein
MIYNNEILRQAIILNNMYVSPCSCFYQTLVRTNQIDQRREVLMSMRSKVVNVAYDWQGKNLYLSDIAKPALIVCPLNRIKDGCLSLLHEKTGSVALHPEKG